MTQKHTESAPPHSEDTGPMRILLITQWFDPEPTFKGMLFAKELQSLGHDVQVLTGFPNYPGGKIYEGYRVKPWQREVVDGIRILRVPLYPSHDGSAIRRIANYMSFALSASIGALASRRPDVAYIYHPPATVALPALVLKALKGVPFVYDVQDLWPDSLKATGMLTHPRLLKVIGRSMTRVYRGASRVVVLSEGFCKALIERGVSARRINVIPNWADEQQIEMLPPSQDRYVELGFGGKFTVTFAGNLGKVQGLETVLDAAERLVDVPDVRFLLVGGGVNAAELAEKARARNLSNVDFLSRRPIHEMGEILVSSDALLVHLIDDPLFSITIPSKTQAYLMAGRPILMGVKGDAAKMVSDAGAGIVFEPGNAAQLADAVLRLKAMSSARRAQLGASGRQFYQDRLALSVGTREFIRVFRVARLSKPHFQLLKRVVDLGVGAAALAALSLPIAVTAVLVRVKLGTPVMFRQTRPGRDGVPFEMVKFRTMNDGRDDSGALLPDGERLGTFGAALRASSVDELPTLWNVLRGHMSLVGPRPLLMRYTKYFTEEEQLRLLVRPGITGWAQIHGRNELSWNSRLAHDVWYVRNMSARIDARILVGTLVGVFRGSGVVVDPGSEMKNLDEERREAVSA
ncbi:sugar transferase [Rathayibacter soli]|uniref:sugar transferase n=1 Tax=Rathayibacter soli TaxID=3144168 RepID=UPI0027E542C6|nr:sugar transferase [Glaciibacter superstes]